MARPTLEDILTEECHLEVTAAPEPGSTGQRLQTAHLESPDVRDLLRVLAAHGLTVEPLDRATAMAQDVDGTCVRLVVEPTLDEWLKACCEAVLANEDRALDGGDAQITGWTGDTAYDPQWWAAQSARPLEAARQWLARGKFGDPMAPVRAEAEVLAILLKTESGGGWQPPMQWIMMSLALKPELRQAARALAGRAPVRVSVSSNVEGHGRG